MRASGCLAIALLLASMATARADTCDQAMSQRDMDVCAQKDFDNNDAALNATYKKVLARLKDVEPTRKLFVDAQKAWLGFRDAECGFSSSDSIGGTMHGMVDVNCKARLTKDRTKTLNGYLTCGRDDTECPLPQP